MTQRRKSSSGPPGNDDAAAKRYKDHLDQRLDEALRETFPASDPIAVTPRRKRPPPPRKGGASQPRERRS